MDDDWGDPYNLGNLLAGGLARWRLRHSIQLFFETQL